MLGEEGVNLAVGLVADRVDLRRELLARDSRILVEQCLDLVLVFLKQRPDLLLLFRGQFEVFGQMGEFLIDRAGTMNRPKLLLCEWRTGCVFLGCGDAGGPECKDCCDESKRLMSHRFSWS